MGRAKRGKTDEAEEEQQELIPGLPDHLAHLCLSRLPAPLLFSVCHAWRRLLYSSSFPPFLSVYALLSSEANSDVEKHQNCLGFFSFDPIAGTWRALPPPPPDPPLGLLLVRHPSFIARHLPIQSVSLSGHLLLLAASTQELRPALHRPLVFHPVTNQWRLGPPISAPRRWCATGTAGGYVYVASGIGEEYSPLVARSAERWDLRKPSWEKVATLKDGKFTRDAVEAAGCREKLCMVNVKGSGPKEGAVYDVRLDRWGEMPRGLLDGWTGPSASMAEQVIYVLDELKGALKSYDWEKDCWKVLMESEYLVGALQMVAGGGRICAVRAGGAGIAVLDVVAQPARLWLVDPPLGMQVVAVHVLPRMSDTEP